jgi:hypothetical protein
MLCVGRNEGGILRGRCFVRLGTFFVKVISLTKNDTGPISRETEIQDTAGKHRPLFALIPVVIP